MSAVVAIDELIKTFETNNNTITKPKTFTITKKVIKVEHFSDDYHEMDMNELLNNRELMQQILLMEQQEEDIKLKEIESKEDIKLSPKSYLPSKQELEIIKTNLSDIQDIEISESSSIINYAHKFKIDKFKFAIQFMIFPKAFINCWLGFIGTETEKPSSIPSMLGGLGGIGGQQMGGPISMQRQDQQREHYLSNLIISIPHRKPLNDEFGKTTMSSMALISDSNDTVSNDDDGGNFVLSVNDLSMKLSKMLTRISKSTVQISCDIPLEILNAPIQNKRRFMRNRMDIDNFGMNDMNETNMLFQIEKTVMNIYNNNIQKK